MLWWTLQQLKSKDANTRLKGIEKLAATDEAAAFEPFLEALTDESPEVRRTVAQWLGKFKDQRAVPPLVKTLHDRDASVREAAAGALNTIGDKQAMEPLAAALKDSDASVRWQAAHALESLQWAPSNELENALQLVALGKLDRAAKLGSVAIDPLVSVLKSSAYYKRIQAVEALSRLGDSRVVKPLIEALRDEDNNVRVRVVEALGTLAEARAVEPLIALLRDPHPQVRATAVEALSKIGDSRAIEPLARLSKDTGWEVRMAAVEALGKFRDQRVIPHLVKCLEDKDRDTRLAAVMSLGRVGNDEVIEPLVVVLTDDQDNVRQTAKGVLNKLSKEWEKTPGARAAAVALRQRLQHPDYWVRQTAAEVLAKISGNTTSTDIEPGQMRVRIADSMQAKRQIAMNAMLSALKDPDRDLRHAAAIALGCLGEKQVGGELSQTLRDKDEWVSKAAATALQSLGTDLENVALKARQYILLERWNEAAKLGEAAIPPLSEASASRSSPTRLAAVQALDQVASPLAAEALTARLLDDAAPVRHAAAQALHRMGWKPHSPELSGHFGIEIGDWAAAADGGLRVLPVLLEMIKNKSGNPDTWQGAESALARLHDANATALLIDLGTDPDLSFAVVQALENIMSRHGSMVDEAELIAMLNLPDLNQHQYEFDADSSSFQIIGFHPVDTGRVKEFAERELERRKTAMSAIG